MKQTREIIKEVITCDKCGEILDEENDENMDCDICGEGDWCENCLVYSVEIDPESENVNCCPKCYNLMLPVLKQIEDLKKDRGKLYAILQNFRGSKYGL
jgi:hypothetical protein